MELLALPKGIEEARIRVRGTEIYCIFREDPSPEAPERPAVVYLHGNTGTCRWWDLVMDIPGYHSFALDMPNFGLSEALDESDIGLYADYVTGFIEAMELQRPVLVCHSLGGAVGLDLAARYPEAFSGLVLVDSAAPSGLVTPEEHYPAIAMFQTNKEMLASALGAVMPGLEDQGRRQMLVDLAFGMNGESFEGNARALARFSVVGQLRSFAAPVLVVWGAKDQIITRAMVDETINEFAEGIAEGLIIEDCGHSPMVEVPEQFRGLVIDFLAGL